jgi:hypothetical protein
MKMQEHISQDLASFVKVYASWVTFDVCAGTLKHRWNMGGKQIHIRCGFKGQTFLHSLPTISPKAKSLKLDENNCL